MSPAFAMLAEVIDADTPLVQIPGIGPRLAALLARLDLLVVQDLLFHLPLRYQDRTQVCPLAALCPGEALIDAEVCDAQISYGRRRTLQVLVQDGSGGQLVLRFFHFSPAQARSFTPKTRLRAFGAVRAGPCGWEMVHPEYTIITAQSPPLETTLTPIYPSTAGLSQASWRKLMTRALALLAGPAPALRDWLPRALLASLGLPSLTEALRLLHQPPVGTSLAALHDRQHPALRRLILEELLAHRLALRHLRRQRRACQAPVLEGDGRLRARLRAQLGFRLTAAQERALTEIAADLVQPRPMQRLLQGDVGSGKTVVAALAALQAIECGYQVALMVPTELLAEQHVRNFQRWLTPLGLTPCWLSGRQQGRARIQALTALATGAPLVIGTHALFQDEVRFAALGLAIIDEQHRFGVHQRLRLRAKGESEGWAPHQLIMTATPIPRSLAMVAYADLDLSVIDELPPGRQPVVTVAVPDTKREQVIARVRAACGSGRQAYWVCTLIDESEVLQCQAAEDTAAQLAASLPELRIGLVHGRLKSTEREEIMAAFAAGALDLLVATTVIEVGVDVPNATLMIIENPERLGLAQLHQLRGRVGRGAAASFCVLLYHPPLTAAAQERLRIVRAEHSGFAIAEADLRLRGAGEVLGTRQAGAARLRLADPLRDGALVELARELAERVAREHPECIAPLIQRWLGRRMDYVQV